MTGIAGLAAFRDADGTINVVVETPRGSRAKYKYEPRSGAFELHKALAMGFAYPFPFGFIPGTLGEDGDPLDVLLLTDLDPPTGAIVPARLIGALEVEQTDQSRKTVRNDRLLAVPIAPHQDRKVSDINAVPPGELEDLESFFIWSGRRDGKTVKVLARRDAACALAAVKRGLKEAAG